MITAPAPNTPRIRFRGFTEPWEKTYIGRLMDVGSVKRVHQSDWTSNGIRFLRARDLVAFFEKSDIEDKLYISRDLYNSFSVVSGKVSKDDLLVTGVGTIGIPYLIPNKEPVYFKDGNIIWLKNNNLVYGRFLYHSFTSEYITKFIKESAGVGTVGTYTITTCKNTPILLPEKKEQQRIGDFFHQQDDNINNAKLQIDKLRTIKQACLQGMFV